MNRNECMASMKGKIYNVAPCTIYDFIHGNEKPEEILSSLIYSLGFDKIEISKSNGILMFDVSIGSDKKNVLCYEINSNKLSGALKIEVESAFKIVLGIENELQDSLMYPHNLRQKIINEFITINNISKDTYDVVLKNWKVNKF